MNQNMSGEPTNYLKLQCPDCGAHIELVPTQGASCPACGRKFLIDEAGGLVVDVNVDYGDAKKTKTAFTITLIILGYILGIALTVLLIIFGFNYDAIHSRMSSSDYEWFKPKSKVSHKFCEDIFGKDYKDISKEELESIRYIKYDNERLSGTNEFLHIIEYSFTDYQGCENEDAFMKTVKKWTFQEAYGDEVMDFSMFTGLTRITLGGYPHKINKASFAKSADIRYVTSYFDLSIEYIKELVDPEKVEILECKVHDNLQGLDSFPNLKSLNIRQLSWQTFDFSHIAHCKTLEKLTVTGLANTYLGLSKIGTLENLKSLSLEREFLHNCGFISNLTKLEELTIKLDDEKPEIEILKNLNNLNSLHLLGLGYVSEEDIASFADVEELKLSVNTLEAVEELAKLKNLKVLDVHMEVPCDDMDAWPRKSVLDLSCLAELSDLEYLHIQPEQEFFSEALYVYGLEPILNHPKLKGIYINEQVMPTFQHSYDEEITLCMDSTLLNNNDQLKQLQFVGCIFEDLNTQTPIKPTFLQNYTNLEYLVVDSCGIEKISFVKSMPQLKYCSFVQNAIEDFSPLKECKFLEVAGLYFNPNVTPELSKEVVLLSGESDGVNLTEYLLGIERTVGYIKIQETDEDE